MEMNHTWLLAAKYDCLVFKHLNLLGGERDINQG